MFLTVQFRFEHWMLTWMFRCKQHLCPVIYSFKASYVEMDIFGSTFDDSMFGEARDKVHVSLSSYNAKRCESEWFCESTDTEDSLEKQKIFKFQADLAYRQNNYQKSLNAYTSCLALVPDSNLTMKRDILEGMARCCCRLGKEEQALEITEILRKEASNTCHLTGLLHLMVNIHEHFGDLRSKITFLQQLCSLHPYNHWHWMKLAESYMSLLEVLSAPSNSTSPKQKHTAGQQPVTQTEEQLKKEKDCVCLKASMCFVRARLLFGMLKNQQSSFVLQNSERAMQRTDEALQCLGPNERTVQLISEVMGEDLFAEKMREDNQDGESLAGLCVKDFEDRWWNRLILTGLLEESTDLKCSPNVK